LTSIFEDQYAKSVTYVVLQKSTLNVTYVMQLFV
jgi:hypothetical protein